MNMYPELIKTLEVYVLIHYELVNFHYESVFCHLLLVNDSLRSPGARKVGHTFFVSE